MRRRRIAPDVEAVLVEGGAEQLDLRPGGRLLGLADAAEETRAVVVEEERPGPAQGGSVGADAWRVFAVTAGSR